MTALPHQTDQPNTGILTGALDPMTREVPTLQVLVAAPSVEEADLVLDIGSGFDRVIGRDASADVTVPDPTISRRHARITHGSVGVWLEDLGSTNGTYVNGRRLLDRCRLNDGDEVKIGNAVAMFHDAIRAPDSTEQLQVVRDVSSPPDSTERREPAIEASGVSCPRCSAVPAPNTWFCHQCGYQHSPIAIQQAAPGRAHNQAIRQNVIGPHGRIRFWQFRQVMRSRHGGRLPLYNESMAIPAFLLRVLVVTVLIVAALAALIVFGLGVHHFVQLRQQPGGRSLARHSHSFVPTRFHTRTR
jgi:pSer/pThr/pTyr-binding forkhead associated (FHA) protein